MPRKVQEILIFYFKIHPKIGIKHLNKPKGTQDKKPTPNPKYLLEYQNPAPSKCYITRLKKIEKLTENILVYSISKCA